MRASMRRHPSFSYEIPEPRSHVRVLDETVVDDEPIAPVISLAAARARLRSAS